MTAPRPARRPPKSTTNGSVPMSTILLSVAILIGVAAILVVALDIFPGRPGASTGTDGGSPVAGRTSPPEGVYSPPPVTPLASPPAQPAGDGTQATVETELGDIVIEVYTDSSPVAARNFINLAEAGFYDGVVFHRIAPGFVIQGGDPEGTGGGGPGYGIADEPVVGDYVRGTVAMARTAAPNSQGSQFFIVLDDDVQNTLPKSGAYAIFGRVVEGMDVVDQIAAGPAGGPQGDTALEPVAMTSVTIEPPAE
jgi:peptidyl-prolyl cis-trans isomerase B (cyclophilin B)